MVTSVRTEDTGRAADGLSDTLGEIAPGDALNEVPDDGLDFPDDDSPAVRRASEMASAAFAEDGRSR